MRQDKGQPQNRDTNSVDSPFLSLLDSGEPNRDRQGGTQQTTWWDSEKVPTVSHKSGMCICKMWLLKYSNNKVKKIPFL